jgi:hypothetical protein
MKNTVMIDFDSDREEPIIITKPENTLEGIDDGDKAKKMVLEDITTVCNALGTLIKLSNDSGYLDGETSANMCIEYLRDNFISDSDSEE